jgi:hypothetical protein
MRSGFKFAAFVGIAVLAFGTLSPASTSTHSKKKAAPKVELPPLPSGPQGPVPQIPLDSIAPVAPQVSYQNGQLTIVAPNSTLGDILRAVRKQTSADIEIPPATERVVTHLGPGPAREIVAELLNGSRFNYVLLGSPEDTSALTRVVLVAKSGPDNVVSAPGQPQQPQPGQPQGNMAPPPTEAAPDVSDAPDAAEENPDDNADQNAAAAAEAEQQAPPPDAPGIKTPQQMLQEMQQRQLQLQQNQPPGQPPIPGGGFPGRPMQPPQPEQQ